VQLDSAAVAPREEQVDAGKRGCVAYASERGDLGDEGVRVGASQVIRESRQRILGRRLGRLAANKREPHGGSHCFVRSDGRQQQYGARLVREEDVVSRAAPSEPHLAGPLTLIGLEAESVGRKFIEWRDDLDRRGECAHRRRRTCGREKGDGKQRAKWEKRGRRFSRTPSLRWSAPSWCPRRRESLPQSV